MLKTLTLAAIASSVAVSAASAQKIQDRVPGFGPPITVSQALDPARPDIVRGTIVVPSDEALTAQNRADEADQQRAQIQTGEVRRVVPEQQPHQWLTSRLTGTDVLAADGTKVGDVRDIVLNGDGTMAAVLIGVGGFLGIGAREIAVTLDSIEVLPAPDGGREQLKLAFTKAQLDRTAEFKRYRPPRPVAAAPLQPSPTE